MNLFSSDLASDKEKAGEFMVKWRNTWAKSWENLFMPYATNKVADQPAHPRSLISTFVVCCLHSMIP